MDRDEHELHFRLEDVHWWFRARREIVLDVLSRFVPPGRGHRVLEIGCGTGGNLRRLEPLYRTAGTDISRHAIDLARSRTGGDLFAGDFRDLPSALWAVTDAVLLLDVLEHVEEDGAFLRDLWLKLRAGAFAVVTVPAHPSLASCHDAVLGHRRRYTAASLRALWPARGARERFFSSFNTFLFPPIALVRLLARAGRSRARSDLSLPPAWMNGLLYRIFSLEKAFLRVAPLPVGVSYIAVLEKE